MSQILIRITTAFLVLICTSPTFGWGGDGHKIVGKIASKHLTPEAQAGVRELLGKRTLADVSVWANRHTPRCFAPRKERRRSSRITA